MASVRSVTAVGLAYLLCWTGLDWVAAQFEVARGVSLWYPPVALDVVLLLVLGVRWAPLLLVTVVIHTTIVVPVGLAWWQIAVLVTTSAGSYTAAAAGLIRGLRIDPGLRGLRDVVWLGVLMCLAAPLPVAVVQVWLLNGAGAVDSTDFSTGVAGFWAGSATGVGMLAPVLLVLARRRRADVPLTEGRRPPHHGLVRTGLDTLLSAVRRLSAEQAGQTALLALVVWVAFDNSGGSLDYSYLVYVPLIWIALRGGFVPATLAVLAVNTSAVALNGGAVPEQGGFALQFGLVTLTLLGVLLGAAVSQRAADAEASRRAALADPLTGLANRTLLADRVRQALARRLPDQVQAGDGARGALLFLDLDRFKQVNDSLGHGAGDAVLTEIGHRLRATTRAGDTVARLGGDEFAVLLDGQQDHAEVTATAARMLTAIAEPIQVGAGQVHISASIGSTLLDGPRSSPPSRTAAEVVHHADIALSHAKTRGRNQHVPFDSGMHAHAVTVQTRDSALRTSIARDEISVVFQPVVAIDRRTVVGAEALARWSLPDGEPVDPAEFIAAAEDSGLITVLGLSVLRRACQAATRWPTTTSAPGGLRVAVNVSAVELRDPGYAKAVLGVLVETGLPADRLELEITETQWVVHAAATAAALTDLTRAGVHLVLDDFGTGYSSMSHLADMPVTGVKIDRSFVGAVTTDPRAASVVRAVLCMAAEFDLVVTAEGVETAAQLDFLAEHGCHRVQGHLLGRPSPGPPGLAMPSPAR